MLCAPPQSNPGLQKILSAAFGLQYGLMMVIVCGAELFTGNTATMTAAFWEGKATAGQVVKNWVCSYSGGWRSSYLFAVVCLLFWRSKIGHCADSPAPGAVAVPAQLHHCLLD